MLDTHCQLFEKAQDWREREEEVVQAGRQSRQIDQITDNGTRETRTEPELDHCRT